MRKFYFVEYLLKSFYSLLIAVVISRYLGPDFFGEYTLYTNIYFLIVPFVIFGLETVLISYLVKSRDYSVIFNTIKIMTLIWLLLFITLFPIFFVLNKDDWLICFIVFTSVLSSIFLPANYYLQSILRFDLSLFGFLIGLIITCLFKALVLVYYPTMLMILLSFLVDQFCFVIVKFIICVVFKTHREKLFSGWPISIKEQPQLKEIFNSSLPLFISGFVVILFMRTDQLMIGYFLGKQDVGIYSVSSKINEGLILLPSLLIGSIFPLMIEKFSKNVNDGINFCANILKKSTLMCLFITVLLIFFSDYIFTIVFGVQYLGSSEIFKIQCVSLIFVSFGLLNTKLAVIFNKTKLVLLNNIFSLILNIIFNFILIPSMGAKGAAIATVITQFFSSFFIWYFYKTLPSREIYKTTFFIWLK